MSDLFVNVVEKFDALLRGNSAWQREPEEGCDNFVLYTHRSTQQWVDVLCEDEGITVRGLLPLSAQIDLDVDFEKKFLTVSDRDSTRFINLDIVGIPCKHVYVATTPQDDQYTLELILGHLVDCIANGHN
jgi:hypothetical protein